MIFPKSSARLSAIVALLSISYFTQTVSKPSTN
jgi:hypothetical protein